MLPKRVVRVYLGRVQIFRFRKIQEAIIQSPAGIVAIARHVKPGSEVEFEEAVRGVILAASTFPGYAGGEVLYPTTKRGEWQLILRFDTLVHLQKWEESPICQGWIARADALTIGDPKVLRVNGLEAWFVLPEVPRAMLESGV